MKPLLLLQNPRFVSCVTGKRLINHFGAGDFISLQMKEINLTRHGIFRGKISVRKINNQNHLEERTPSAPNP